MPRPFCRRRIGWVPKTKCFYPDARISGSKQPEKIILTLDELEAIRLADFLGLYQEEAARKMGISRPTFGRIIDSARKKVADFMVEGKVLCIEGGPVKLESTWPAESETDLIADQPGPSFPFSGPRFRKGGQIMSYKKHGHKLAYGLPADLHHGRRGYQAIGLGPEGFCLCPKCGFRQPHQPGVPCIKERCPKCGSALVREGSEHHRQIVENKSKKEKKGSE